MAYTKQTFTSGQTLKASDLNTMSQGIKDLDDGKQAKLVSGTSLKTINGQSLLGSGDITVEGGDVTIDGASLGAKYAGLYGKKVSFLGDSITTFNGWMPSSYATFYPRYTITDVEKTWWKQLLNTSGMELLVNASWSGSSVSSSRNSGVSNDTTSAKMGSSDKRIADLSADGVTPDIIICFIGANDFADNVPTGSWDGTSLPMEGKISTFSEAYALMVSKVLKAYPKAEVYLCTILEATGSYNSMDDLSTGTFPCAFKDSSDAIVTIDTYNQIIRKVASSMGVNVLDMHACGITYFNADTTLGDTLHPNGVGAVLMARKALAEISAKSIYMHPLGIASEPTDVYYTVTYEYKDTSGNTVSGNTTKRVLSGTTLALSTSDAPDITGYTISKVSHTNVTVTSDITITFTYEPIANVTYYTVTYKYVDSEGNSIKADSTQSVAEGVTINAITGNAPSIDGYKVASVSPSGSVTVNKDTVVTYVYNAIVYRTITYNYVASNGSTIKEATTQQVIDGTVLNLSVDNAPTVDGYSVSSVAPSGTVEVTEDMAVTYTYKTVTWYVNASTKTSHTGIAGPVYGAFAYSHTDTINACIGVPINSLRMFVAAAGVISYGKVSSTAYETLGTINLVNPSNTTLQTYEIDEVVLSEGERLWFTVPTDTGKFYYGKSTNSAYPQGAFNTKVSATNLEGYGDASGGARENLSIDIGYVG